MHARAGTNYDEMIDPDGSVRPAYDEFRQWYDRQDIDWLRKQDAEAERFFRRIGITFNVYGNEDGEERLIPFDMIPRIITAREWRRLTRGIEQRVRALNAFLQDLYHRQEIVRSGRLPIRYLRENPAFLPQMIGFLPPGGIYTHIVGIDLVRTGPDQFMVLEDNARTPSGVSYMLENRETMMAMFPELFSRIPVRQVSDYPRRLSRSLRACAPACAAERPTLAVLTPGIYNSAYFEHAFLADQMGAELVEGSDLRVVDGRVAMRCTTGYQPIDVLYRRVDDDFLDPLSFNPSSVLGAAGIMDVYRAGGITIANAPGTGIADDKALYSFMPDIIEFYTGEKPILQNVATWRCSEPDSLRYVLDNLSELVVKEVHGSGGYGMLVGPAASRAELAGFAAKLRENPENYIAQPTLALSTVPIFTEAGLAPRHVDLRPFVLVSPDGIDITPGGLTRVAIKQGSLVVNSSQGGGTKDSWVLEDSMLGRAANGVYWMSRYLERAENTARLLDVGFRLALTRGSDSSQEEEWRSVLITAGQDAAYRQHHGEYTGAQVFNFLLRGKENPVSVLKMIEAARTNARIVRTSITSEVWEATNESWMILRDAMALPVRETNLGEVLAAVRRQATLVCGAIEGSMLRNEVFNFSRIGTFIERADNTARILDVKYYVLLPSVAWVGSSLDNAQWDTLLRSVAGDRAYRWLNAGRMDARDVARFLILDRQFPRSLVFCYDKLRSNMAGLALQYGHEGGAHELLRNAGTRLHQTSMEEVLNRGLHEFLQDFIAQTHRLGDAIAADYRFTE